MNIYNREIIHGHNYLYKLAKEAFNRENLDSANDYISKYSAIANAGNWIYHNQNVVDLLERIAHVYYPNAITPYDAQPKRVAFYDQYGIYYVLALQYLRALVQNGYEVLYILSDYDVLDAPSTILPELKDNKSIKVHIVDKQLSLKERMHNIVEATIAYKPAKIFMHVRDCSAFNYAITVIPKCCDVYYINQHDHAFWIKNNRIDYSIPYRAWGATIDVEKRGFRPNQELLIPYYPIISETPFQGFPDNANGHVVLFTGGTQFKTYDEENTYWKLVIQILMQNPQAIVLYAIKGEVNNRQLDAVKALTSDKSVLSRLVSIGFRTDINEVFKHCDIFLGTCPMSGGLMSQYAAINSKPILQYYPPSMAANNETEQVLDYNAKEKISFTDKKLFLEEAKKLIGDATYRQKRGEAISKCIITKEQFDDLLMATIEKNCNQVQYEKIHIDYDVFAQWWLSMEKWGFAHFNSYLRSILKKRKYIVMPFSSITNIRNMITWKR